MTSNDGKSIAEKTGELYASIWDRFSESEWEKFSDDHFKRWSPLPVPEEFFKGKVCLDAGCGSGRAARSLLLAGARKVCAVDVGEGCIRNTRTRNTEFADRLELRTGSVLRLPYPDESFDFVHCDGVLHHTTDPEKGFSELVRVTKPKGHIVMAVYGKGGLMNLAIYSARIFRKIVPQSITLSLVKKLSANPVNWYAVMDCMYVPIRENYRERDILDWFRKAGLINVKRLDSEWGPYVYSRWMKGEGYLKFICEKP